MEFFVSFGDEVYEGMVVGENSCDNDFVVNFIKEKKFINICVVGSDDNVIFKLVCKFLLEVVFEYIVEDEMVEIMFFNIRICKVYL